MVDLSGQLAGADNQVFSGRLGLPPKTWRERGRMQYAKWDVSPPYPDDAVLPRAAHFVVGDRENWYDSAVGQAAHAAWLAATDPGRETAISLARSESYAQIAKWEVMNEGFGLPLGRMDGIGSARTTTYGTHGAITQLHISPADRDPIGGTIWLPEVGRWEGADDARIRLTSYLTWAELFATSRAPEGINPGQRWLCPQIPGTRLWWSLMSLSLTTRGHDVVLIEPGHDFHRSGARTSEATVMAATSEQWGWVLANWGEEVKALDLQHAVIVETERTQATEAWLEYVFPRAQVRYGFVEAD